MPIVANVGKLGIMQLGAYLVLNLGKSKVFLGFLLITFVCSACKNVFETQENKWKFITRTTTGNFKSVYVDENRVEHKGNTVKVWTKVVFQELEAIPFESKEGRAVLMTKRVDSSVLYNCDAQTSTVLSYQLYDGDDKFIYNQWLNDPETNDITASTVDEEMYLYLCVADRKETNGQAAL
jgi:hypothetical protein